MSIERSYKEVLKRGSIVFLAVALVGCSIFPQSSVMAQEPQAITIQEGPLPLGTVSSFVSDGKTHCFDVRTVILEGESDPTVVSIPNGDVIAELYPGECDSPQSDALIAQNTAPQIEDEDSGMRLQFDLPPGSYSLNLLAENTGENVEVSADSDGRIIPLPKDVHIESNTQKVTDLGTVTNNGLADSKATIGIDLAKHGVTTSTLSIPAGGSISITDTLPAMEAGTSVAKVTICPENFGAITPKCETIDVPISSGSSVWLPLISDQTPTLNPCDDPTNTCADSAIILAGRYGNNLRTAIAHTANELAGALESTIGGENVHLMSADPTECASNARVDHCIGSDTDLLANLSVFLDLQASGETVPIFLIDHGKTGTGALLLGYQAERYELTPYELFSFLQTTHSDLKFILVSGLCFSGQWLKSATDFPDLDLKFALSTGDTFAYATDVGGTLVDPYSYGYLDLAQGKSYGDIHQHFIPPQISQLPQLDANRNGISNEPEDFNIMKRLYLNYLHPNNN